MGIIEFRPDRDVSVLAERVATLCRNRMLESRTGAVAFLYIETHLDIDRSQLLRAIRWLEQAGRAEVRNFSLRTRPHVTVPAVCRIDDVGFVESHAK